jgi:hypothetical protein
MIQRHKKINKKQQDSSFSDTGDNSVTPPAFSLDIVKWPAVVAICCLAILLALTVSKFLMPTDNKPAHERKRRPPIVPIFLALYEKDGHVVYVNENDFDLPPKRWTRS